ncbi:MAG TPA: TolC family protein [Bacteroidales bacterium]|nr:TolC family protein [Bacteroidales bacterium]HPT21654.1 TolC family protein [Bacteroidales bacterium]
MKTILKMQTILYSRFVLILLISWSAVPAWGQQLPDSLLKYLEIAAKNNPAVGQKFYEYQAALQKVPQAGSLPDPELSAGVFLQPMELVSGNQIADMRLMQMFPWFWVLKSARDEMSLMANAKFELFRDAKLQVYYDVQHSWYELYKVRKDISITESNIEILKTIERLAIVKFQSAPASNSGGQLLNSPSVPATSQNSISNTSSGMQSMAGAQSGSSANNIMQSSQGVQSGSMGSPEGISELADLYRIQIESGELLNVIAELKNQDKTIVARFNSYLNRPPETSVFTPESFNTDTLSLPLISVTDSIFKNSPMLAMLEYEKQSINARKKMVKSMGYPMIGLGLNFSIIVKSDMSASSMNGNDMIMPMVSVTLPIYRKKYKALVTEANLLEKATLNDYTSTANSLQTEFYLVVQQYQDAQRRVRLYNNQFQLASKSLEIIIKSYTVSTASLTDLLRIRQQTFDYELKQAEAKADLNTATAFLKRLMASSEIE